jgi:hypothetical protein
MIDVVTYLPGAINTRSPEEAASTADWIVG